MFLNFILCLELTFSVILSLQHNRIFSTVAGASNLKYPTILTSCLAEYIAFFIAK